MKKIEFVDLIKHKLAGGDCPQELKGKYHPEIIARHLSMAFNHAVNRRFDADAKRGMFDNLDAFTTTYSGIDVEYDKGRQEYYAIIPKSYMSLPKNRGVRLVYPDGSVENFFKYRENNRATIMSNLDVDKIAEYVAFYIENDRVYFAHLSPEYVEKVSIKLIPTFEALDDSEYVPIPAGYEKMLFDLVVESMMRQRPEKMSNDENSNTQ